METKEASLAQLRSEAIALRRLGKSRREIKESLAIKSNAQLNDALRGEPPQPSVRRPNANDEARAKARELRAQGLAYSQISAALGVSRSSVSLWVRDLPKPARLTYEECRRRQNAAVTAYWTTERLRREAARESARALSRDLIGPVTDRDLLIAGVVAYWCEGAKSKPQRRAERLSFINGDPGLVRLYLRFLNLMEVAPDRLVFRLMIHESADIQGAQEFWLRVTNADPARFRRPTLKRHNPMTVRHNTGSDYRGCLRIDVLGGANLYRQVEGYFEGIIAEVGLPALATKGCR